MVFREHTKTARIFLCGIAIYELDHAVFSTQRGLRILPKLWKDHPQDHFRPNRRRILQVKLHASGVFEIYEICTFLLFSKHIIVEKVRRKTTEFGDFQRTSPILGR